MKPNDEQTLAEEVLAELHAQPRVRAHAIARRLHRPLTDIYQALVQLNDRDLARVDNTCRSWKRETGRACLWSAT